MDYVILKNYQKQIKQREILIDIDLTIPENEVVALLGRNASGKTMLLRAISGLIKPTAGEVLIKGKRLTDAHPFPESLGILLGSITFWPHCTALQCLKTLAAINNKIGEKEIKETLIRVGLDPEDNRPVRKFSMGMVQKLAIAQAIMEKPELILLDEPTNSLDTNSRQLFHQIIADEKERGATIVIASHIKEDLEECCTIFHEVENGRLIS